MHKKYLKLKGLKRKWSGNLILKLQTNKSNFLSSSTSSDIFFARKSKLLYICRIMLEVEEFNHSFLKIILHNLNRLYNYKSRL